MSADPERCEDGPVTIVEFYTARLDELEDVARGASSLAWDTGRGGGIVSEWIDQSALDHIAANGPSYVLADTAAKRAVVAMAQRWINADQGRPHQRALSLAGQDVLQRMCQPFAAHPDFDPAWRI